VKEGGLFHNGGGKNGKKKEWGGGERLSAWHDFNITGGKDGFPVSPCLKKQTLAGGRVGPGVFGQRRGSRGGIEQAVEKIVLLPSFAWGEESRAMWGGTESRPRRVTDLLRES